MLRCSSRQALGLLSTAAFLLLSACGGNNTAHQVNPPPTAAFPVPQSTSPMAAPVAATTISFPGKRENYLITKISNGYIVTDITGNGSSTTYSNISAIQFADYRVNLGIADQAKSMNVGDVSGLIELYLAFLNRVPDADGLSYWMDRLSAGAPIEQIGESFYAAAVQQPLQTGYFADMSHADFIRNVYLRVLSRTGNTAPNADEIAYWSQQLDAGQSKTAIVKTILQAAHEYAADPNWAWVSSLLDNKINVAYLFAVQQGLNLNAADPVNQSTAILAAVTSNDVSKAIGLIGIQGLTLYSELSGSSGSLANQCAPDAQKSWVRSHLDDVYLWYKEIIDTSPALYSTAADYFSSLLVRSKDRFSFTSIQSGIDDYFQSGLDVSYGYTLMRQGSQLRVVYVQPNSPADQAQLKRGATITAIDNTSLATPANATQYSALYPTQMESHLFDIRNPGSQQIRQIRMTASRVVRSPVLQNTVLSSGGKKIGYLVFTDHIATAEAPLFAAFQQFQQTGIDELVLDLRYNGGGYLYIANELAAMIGGEKVSNQIFEQLQFNDKHPEKTNSNIDYFYDTDSRNVRLPQLNLPRVFVLTGANTCSASESVINSLSPWMDVILIGGQTCGKPYGFIQQNNCSTAYFAIQFSGVNAVGKADYVNGFTPRCQVADDLEHELGNLNESRLSAALSYARTGSCPAAVFNPPPSATPDMPAERDPHPWRNIRLMKSTAVPGTAERK